MKNRILLLLSATTLMGLQGCASHGALAHAATAPISSKALSAYSWQLVKATNAQGQTIQSLFVQPDKPVTLHFQDNSININNTCNHMGGAFKLQQHQLSVHRLASTMMMCPGHLNELDQSISHLLEGNSEIKLNQFTGSAPQLSIITAQHDQLTWQGVPTAETKYGNQGKIVFLEIAPQTIPCNAGAAEMQCLQVRHLNYNEQGIKTYTSGWENFYDSIEGYTHSDKEHVIVRLKEYPIAHPAADASNKAYVLDMYVERASVK